MIKVEPRSEPDGFDQHVRQPGGEWLRARSGRPVDYPRTFWNEWRPCRDELERTFAWRCGYAACRIPSGNVEHFVSWKSCDQNAQRHFAYEWSNYRWILPHLNSRKGSHALLDPFAVEDDWFELDIISLNLELSTQVPEHMRPLAEFTLMVLGLERDSWIIKQREEALLLYEEGLSLRKLDEVSPIVARAIRRLVSVEVESLSPAHRRFRAELNRRREAARNVDL